MRGSAIGPEGTLADPDSAPVRAWSNRGDRLSARESARALWQALCLWRIWFTLGRRDFSMRFKRMRLGAAWQFVTLCALLLTIGFIYANLFRVNVRDFLVFLAAGLTLWFFITQSIDTGCVALVGSEGYIKQLPVPPLTYAFRFATANSLSLLVTLPAFFVIKLVFQPRFSWHIALALPGLVALAIAAALLSASLAFLNARIRDVQPAVATFMQIMFYVTPVIYTPDQLAKAGYAFIYLYNPCFHLLNIVRAPLLGSTSHLGVSWLWSTATTAVLLALLLWVLSRYNRRIVYYL